LHSPKGLWLQSSIQTAESTRAIRWRRAASLRDHRPTAIFRALPESSSCALRRTRS
jgi:hypothetical protein